MFPIPLFSRSNIATQERAQDTTWYLSGGVAAANVLAAFTSIRAASLAASYSNLKQPGTNDCTAPVAAPTWASATGWTFNGSTTYLQVGSGALATAEPFSMAVLFNADAVDTGYVLGGVFCTTANGQIRIIAGGDIASDPVLASTVSATASKYAASSTGFTAGTWYAGVVTFTTTTNRAAYIDGGSKGTNTEAVTVANTPNATYIAARNAGAGALVNFAGKIGAYSFYNKALSDAEALAISTALLAIP